MPDTTVAVRAGDTLSGIFSAQRLAPAELARVLDAGPAARRLERLRPGDRLEFRRADDGTLLRLVLRADVENAFRFERRAQGFDAHHDRTALERRVTMAQGTIETTLYAAARRAGLANQLIVALAGVFEWDVDLATELREGDRFSVIHEEMFLDGRKVRDGDILAAELVSRGRNLRAVRYQDPGGRVGYYTPDGDSVQKTFLRAPVAFGRVSSRFSHARRHPVLHSIRAHRGVDYAAPIGTPIRATGDGKVTFAGRNGGYGNAVEIAHGGQHTTLYAHMSRFATRLRAGTRVRQGQVIGYVGRSGLASGPHVHYEFRVRGVHQDSLSIELPKGLPVPASARAHFIETTHRLSAQLARLSELQLAAAQ